MKSFLMKMRCLWQDMIKPLMVGYWRPVRLVTKIHAATGCIIMLLVVALVAGVMFSRNDDRSVFMPLGWACLLSFIGAFFFLGLLITYDDQRDAAWRTVIKRRATGSSVVTILKVLHPQHFQSFTSRHGEAFLLALRDGGGHVLRVMELTNEARFLASLGYLEERWHGFFHTWQVSREGWRFLNNLHPMPKKWSPEDGHHNVPSPSPA